LIIVTTGALGTVAVEMNGRVERDSATRETGSGVTFVQTARPVGLNTNVAANLNLAARWFGTSAGQTLTAHWSRGRRAT
jgi:hypothetical protein